MKKTIPLIGALVIGFAAHAQSQDEMAIAPAAPAEAASAPADAASAPADAASAVPKEVVVREGYISFTQHCGANAGGQGTSYGHRAANAVAQIGGGFGLFGTLTRMAVASVAGNAVGGAVEAPIEERKICVTVAFKDGTPDQKTEVPAVVGERLKRKDPAYVRFEDGKPIFNFY